MQANAECVSCFYNYFLKQLTALGLDAGLIEQEAAAYRRTMSEEKEKKSPPDLGRYFWKRILALAGSADPCRQEKDAANRRLLAVEDGLYRRILAADDPVRTAVMLSIGGNVLDTIADLGIDVLAVLEDAIRTGLAVDDLDNFVAALKNAANVLYLVDNAGEIVLDKLLIRLLLEKRLIDYDRFRVAVRGGPAINDATREDAEAVGLPALVRVIDNGDNAFGTSLAFCSPEFLHHFHQADLVIAKGMGNYETLGELAGKPICFLLMAKCNPVQQAIGVPRGSFVCQLKNWR